MNRYMYTQLYRVEPPETIYRNQSVCLCECVCVGVLVCPSAWKGLYIYISCMCVCACVCLCACVRVFVCVCVHVLKFNLFYIMFLNSFFMFGAIFHLVAVVCNGFVYLIRVLCL